MESRIRLKATRKQMYDLFEQNLKGAEGVNIKYFDELKQNHYDVIVRHKELSDNLKGTFTIDRLISTINEKTEKQEKEESISKEDMVNNLHWEYVKESYNLHKIELTNEDENAKDKIQEKINLLRGSLLGQGYTDNDLEGLRKDSYANAKIDQAFIGSKDIQKGDIVKTALSDNTMVLKVDSDNAVLFSGSQFVVAHGIQKENGYVSWGQGDYYDELDDVYAQNEVQQEDDWGLEL